MNEQDERPDTTTDAPEVDERPTGQQQPSTDPKDRVVGNRQHSRAKRHPAALFARLAYLGAIAGLTLVVGLFAPANAVAASSVLHVTASTLVNGSAYCNNAHGGATFTVRGSLLVLGGRARLDHACQIDLATNATVTMTGGSIAGAGSLEILGGAHSTVTLTGMTIDLGGVVNIDPGADFGTGLGGNGGHAVVTNSRLSSEDDTSPFPIAVTGSCDGADGRVTITGSQLVDTQGVGEVDVIASTPSCLSTDPEGGHSSVTDSVLDSGGVFDFISSTAGTHVAFVLFPDGAGDVRGPVGRCTSVATFPNTPCNA